MNRYQRAMQATHMPEDLRQDIRNRLKSQEKAAIHPFRRPSLAALAAALLAVVFLAGGALAAVANGGFSAWFSAKTGGELRPGTDRVIGSLSESPSISVTDEGTTVAVESVYAGDGIAHVMLRITSDVIDFEEDADYFFSGRCYDGSEYPIMSHAMLLYDGADAASVRSAGGLWDCWKTDEEDNSLYMIYTFFVSQDGTEENALSSFRDGHHVMHFELHGLDKYLAPATIEEYPGYWSFDVPLPDTAEEVIFLDTAEIETRNYYSPGTDDPPFYLQLENIVISASAIHFDYQALRHGNTYLYCVFDLTAVLSDGTEIRLSENSRQTLGTPGGDRSQRLYWEIPFDISELDYIKSYGSRIDIPPLTETGSAE